MSLESYAWRLVRDFEHVAPCHVTLAAIPHAVQDRCLAPMPASMPSRSGLPLAMRHVTLPRCPRPLPNRCPPEDFRLARHRQEWPPASGGWFGRRRPSMPVIGAAGPWGSPETF